MVATSLHLPEVAPVEGLEVPYYGVETDPEGPESLPDSTSVHEKESRPAREVVQRPKRWLSARHRRAAIIGLAFLLITAIILGVVFGVRDAR